MKPRFHIQRPDGEEPIGTRKDLRAWIEDGAIRPEDLLYDTDTGEWAPARAHPAFLDALRDVEEEQAEAEERLMDQLRAEAEASGSGEERPVEDPGTPEEAVEVPEAPDDAADEVDLSLVEEEPAKPGEAAAAFIRQMERERQDDPTQRREGEPLVFEGLTTERSGSLPNVTGAAGGASDRPPVRRSPSRRPTPGVAPKPRPKRSASRLLWMGLVAVVAGGLLAAPWLLGERGAEEGGPGSGVVAAPPPGDEELARRAQSSWVEGLEELRSSYDLGPVPEDWLSGAYLAQASAYPEVEAFWGAYSEYVETAAETETDRYREAFLGVLEDAEVEGPMRTLKLRQGLTAFVAQAPERRASYQSTLQLASAALELHRFLLESEAEIRFEPATGDRLSADPVTEAAGTDEATQAGLEAALDGVLEALQGVDGQQEAAAGSDPRWLVRMLTQG